MVAARTRKADSEIRPSRGKRHKAQEDRVVREVVDLEAPAVVDLVVEEAAGADPAVDGHRNAELRGLTLLWEHSDYYASESIARITASTILLVTQH